MAADVGSKGQENTAMSSSSKNENEVISFLNEHNLSQYLESFIINGYDNMQQLVIVSLSQEELEEVVSDVRMTMKGHIKRFIAAISIRKSIRLNPILKRDDKPVESSEIGLQRTQTESRPSCKYLLTKTKHT